MDNQVEKNILRTEAERAQDEAARAGHSAPVYVWGADSTIRRVA